MLRVIITDMTTGVLLEDMILDDKQPQLLQKDWTGQERELARRVANDIALKYEEHEIGFNDPELDASFTRLADRLDEIDRE